MHTCPEIRRERDLLGERSIPSSVYYGINTQRALENFPISGKPVSAHRELVVALAAVKQAAAQANQELGLLPGDVAAAVIAACEDIRRGELHDQFVVDVIQGGAGTSTNMNANEVIANRALEHLGEQKGTYSRVHPLEHVNLGQSTNDVYPTALRLALYDSLSRLQSALASLCSSLRAKALESATVLKLGRTQLQDAVPMTLGQEFEAHVAALDEEEESLRQARARLTRVNLGGTAIGTGLNAHPAYAQLACAELARITGIPVSLAPSLVGSTQSVGVLVQLSGALKQVALKVSKLCNDLRLLASGPTAGLNELRLPPVQSGSSIMPGKVNPVIPEVVNQVAFGIVGNDVTVTLAAEGGQLQLNAFQPIIAHCLFTSIDHLSSACRLLAERCIDGIIANEAHTRAATERSTALVTALSPHLGYEASAEIAEAARLSGRSVRDLVLERHLLAEDSLERLLRPERLTAPTAPQVATDTSAR